jgi:FAD-dependent urate hydroxylase
MKLIAGSGVGGLALARGLIHDGHDVRVMERAATYDQAFGDAWVLRRALALDGEPDELLRRYERCRARPVRVVSRMAASERTNRPPPRRCYAPSPG